MILRPVAGDGVQKDVAQMQLVCVERKPPNAPAVLDGKGYFRYRSGRNGRGEEVPHFARISAVSRFCELNLAENPVSGELLRSAKREAESQRDVTPARPGASDAIQTENREGDELPRLRHVFISQLSEAVIGGYEQIVPADVVPVVERRSVSGDTSGIVPPLLLHLIFQSLPGTQRPAVQLHILQLLRSTGELRIGFRAEIANPVTMIECDVPKGSPAVTEACVRIKPRHIEVSPGGYKS